MFVYVCCGVYVSISLFPISLFIILRLYTYTLKRLVLVEFQVFCMFNQRNDYILKLYNSHIETTPPY